MSPEQQPDEQEALAGYAQPVVYSIPQMDQVHVHKNIAYKNVDGEDLYFDVYYPTDYRRHKPLPAVIFIHGDAPVSILKHIKDHPQYTSWGKLIAASGMIAITANHRSTEGLSNVVGRANDIDDCITYVRDQSTQLHIDANKIGLWTCSAGAFFALRIALYETPDYIRCLSSYYGLTELQAYYQALYGGVAEENDFLRPVFTEDDFAEFSASNLLSLRTTDIPPLFIARAGSDYPVLNSALDQFVGEALAQNVELTLMNHPTGQHSFDLLDKDARTEEIIEATLEFFQKHLLY
ncbi:alpha/beta hydrolase family protein [Dictyobacter arantiisoli]|uniref:BD-FAE-like domain-containing protein n=1 Tax=Dictyobacter arantiisoli TaxID=2014874 RepID=A0A5A5TGG8_9CHLR|nr:prolyl oligopeptidase family serine peptidase [Dictyobacter arantiisoli]GCF10109.1 hypothetical protein KDI_36730 [Dictyobacter arantiisoli]